MSFLTRLKKLTDYVYSPTDPASEDAIRGQIDDSIQEVYDNVQTALADATGAAQVGYSGGYATVEEGLQAFESGGSGTIPPDGTITNNKLVSDIKVGSLALLNTTVKTDIVSAINEVDTNADTNTNGVNQALNPIEPDSVVSQLINVTVPDTNQKKFILDIQTTVTGGAITINKNGEGALSLKNPDGTDVEELSQDTRFFDIIDDSTVFYLAPKGSNPIKSWSNQGVSNTGLTTATMSQRLNVSGSGWVIFVQNASPSAEIVSRLVIDGSDYFGAPTQGKQIVRENTFTTIARFESGFQYYTDFTGRSLVGYVLGDDLNNSLPNLWSDVASTGAQTLRTSVTGSGWILGVETGEDAIRLDIDASTVITFTALRPFPALFRFESGFDFYCGSSTRHGISYVLD